MCSPNSGHSDAIQPRFHIQIKDTHSSVASHLQMTNYCNCINLTKQENLWKRGLLYWHHCFITSCKDLREKCAKSHTVLTRSKIMGLDLLAIIDHGWRHLRHKWDEVPSSSPLPYLKLKGRTSYLLPPKIIFSPLRASMTNSWYILGRLTLVFPINWGTPKLKWRLIKEKIYARGIFSQVEATLEIVLVRFSSPLVVNLLQRLAYPHYPGDQPLPLL